MYFRLKLTAAIVLLTTVPAFCDTDIVIDDFESYANPTELQTAWVSTGTAGQPANSTFLSTSVDGVWDNYDGQVAVFDGTIGVGATSVNQWQDTAFNIAPSATQNVELTVDLAHDALTSNKKLSMGMRYIDGALTENIIELGFYNQLDPGPGGEFFQFAHRSILMPGGQNWQPYGLPEDLDQIFEVHGAPPEDNVGFFHRFKAVISLTEITFSLDLYADGIQNASGGGQADFDGDNDVDGADFLILQRGFGVGSTQAEGDADGNGSVDDADLAIFESEYAQPISGGEAGMDAIDTIAASVTANGFNTLQFGIPSGQGGAGGSSADPFLGVDNVSLRLVDISPAQSTIAAIPEPSCTVLALLALVNMSFVNRRNATRSR